MKEGKEKELCRWIWGLITIPIIVYTLFFTDFVENCNDSIDQLPSSVSVVGSFGGENVIR